MNDLELSFEKEKTIWSGPTQMNLIPPNPRAQELYFFITSKMGRKINLQQRDDNYRCVLEKKTHL